MVPCIGCSCPFMCSSKSSCSCVELLAPLMPELNTIPVTQYRSKSQQILACPHQHTSHFPSQWLATLTSRRLTEQNSYLFSCSLLLSPNLVLACSFYVSLLATIWKCNWWFLWIKKFTSSEKVLSFLGTLLAVAFYNRRPCHIIKVDIIKACWTDVVFYICCTHSNLLQGWN